MADSLAEEYLDSIGRNQSLGAVDKYLAVLEAEHSYSKVSGLCSRKCDGIEIYD